MELTLNPEAEAEAYDEEMGEYITEYVDLIRQYAGPAEVLQDPQGSDPLVLVRVDIGLVECDQPLETIDNG